MTIKEVLKQESVTMGRECKLISHARMKYDILIVMYRVAASEVFFGDITKAISPKRYHHQIRLVVNTKDRNKASVIVKSWFSRSKEF